MAWNEVINQPQVVLPQQGKSIIAVLFPHRGTWNAEFVQKTWIPLAYQPVPWADKVRFLCRVPSLPLARNILLDESMKTGPDRPYVTHFLWVDGDHVVETQKGDVNEALKTLLGLNSPIVTGLYRAKQQHGFNYAIWNQAPPDPNNPTKMGFMHIQSWTGNWIECSVCLHEDTWVYTPTGEVRIKDVKTGNIVLGEMGYQKVLEQTVRDYDDDLVELKVRYLPQVLLTKEHPVLIRKRKWLRRRGMSEWLPLEWVKAEQLALTRDLNKRLNTFCLIPKEKVEMPYNIFIEGKTHEIDKDLAHFFGLWFAEGCAYTTGQDRHYRYQLSFNIKERNLVNFCMKLLRKLGLNPYQADSVEYNVTNVCGESKAFSLVLRREFGVGAKYKSIPEWLFNERREIIKSFIMGLVEGDGHETYVTKYKDKIYHPMTILKLSNDKAILQIQRLLRKIGIIASHRDIPFTTHIIRGKPTYVKQSVLVWSNNPKRLFWAEDDNYYYLPITKIGRVPYKGKVYNLRTTENQFLIPFIVHNCGLGFMLIQRKVLEDLKKAGYGTKEKPFFNWEHPGAMSEDFDFLTKCRSIGYRVMCYTDVRLSHMGELVVMSNGEIRVPDV